MSVEKFKRVFQIASGILAKKSPGLYYLCKAFPVYYSDNYHSSALAEIVDDRFIIFYKNILEVSEDDEVITDEVITNQVLKTWLHEVIHGIYRHCKRMYELYKKEKEFAEKEPDIFNMLANLAFDIKADLNAVNILDSFEISIDNIKVVKIPVLSIDVESASAEEIYYHLKKNCEIIEIEDSLRNLDIVYDKMIIRDKIVFIKNKCKCVNEGSEEIREAGSDEEIEKAITNTLTKAKCAGNLPENIERLVTQLLKPKINWNIKLRQTAISHLTKIIVTTFTKPSRRYEDAPGHRKLSKPKVYAFVDASGSITEKEFNRFMSEIAYMTKFTDEITVIVWDVKILNIVKVKRPSDVKIKFKGGDGTTFEPVITQFKDKIKKQDIMIVLSDGHWFDKQRAVNIIKRINAKKILVTTGDTVDGFNEIIKIRAD